MTVAAPLVRRLRRSANPIAEMVAMALGRSSLPSTLDEVVDLIQILLNYVEMWSSYQDMQYEERERVMRLFLHPQTKMESVKNFMGVLRQYFSDAKIVAQPSPAPSHLAPGQVRLDTSAAYYAIDIPVGKMLDTAQNQRAGEYAA